MSTAITMYIAVLLLTSWLPAHWKRRIVGAGLLADIGVHIILQSMFGGDANGRAGLLLAGVLINATMHAYRGFAGYETVDWKELPNVIIGALNGQPADVWIRHPGRWMAKPAPAPASAAKPRAKRKASTAKGAKPKAKPRSRTKVAP